MKMKQVAILALVVTMLVFSYSVKRISDLRGEYAALQAEVAHKTSAGSITGGMVKSFFDGFTLGIFAEEGPFTEYKKLDKWATEVARREALLTSAYTDAVAQRTWSFIGALFCVGLLFFAVKKEGKAESKSP